MDVNTLFESRRSRVAKPDPALAAKQVYILSCLPISLLLSRGGFSWKLRLLLSLFSYLSWRIFLSKITSKHFDYVLCDKKTLQILAVIELDDKSHNQLKTMERDDFVQAICRNSGLPLVRFDVKSDYHIQLVRDKIIDSLN